MAGNARDVNIDIVGHDHTAAATGSAGRNLDKLKRKADDVNDSNDRMGSSAQKAARKMSTSFVESAGVLRAAGPYAMVAALAAGLAALPWIATAAAIGIVGALGGGLAGIGIAFAAQNKKVRADWSRTKDHVVGKLREMSRPFAPVLSHIAQMASRTFDSFVPSLIRAFRQLAPAIDVFAGRFLDSLRQLQPAIGPAVAAFGVLLDRVGKKLPSAMTTLSNGIINVSNALARNPQAIDDVVDALVGMAGAVLNTIAWLTRMTGVVKFGFMSFQHGARIVQLAAMEVVAAVVNMVNGAIQWMARLPGPLGAPFRSMAKSSARGAAKVNADLARIKTDEARSQINALQANISRLRGKRVVTDADRQAIARSEAMIRSLQGSIDSLHGKTVNVTTYFRTLGSRPPVGTGTVLAPRNSAGRSWEGSGSGVSRTGGPAPTANFDVSNTISIDGAPMRAMVRTAIADRSGRDAWRARVGRR